MYPYLPPSGVATTQVLQHFQEHVDLFLRYGGGEGSMCDVELLLGLLMRSRGTDDLYQTGKHGERKSFARVPL